MSNRIIIIINVMIKTINKDNMINIKYFFLFYFQTLLLAHTKLLTTDQLVDHISQVASDES